MKTVLFLFSIILFFNPLSAQNSFNYELGLEAIQIPNLPGLHSFVFGQYDGKVLLIGGRTDGLHARQPFNAFPASQNNTMIYVVDIENQQVFSRDLTSLSTSLQEQLQSTNMNFHQDNNSLYIIGGYGYSASANDHVTYPYLTSIAVPQVIEAIAGNQAISPYFKQIQDPIFENTGGQLGQLGNTFYLVGGQNFQGRYNPMNHPTFTQTYIEQIQKFTIDNSGNQLSIANYSTETDQVHLHRRDYNLVPQIFPDGTEGFMISSGVFQLNVDLPFLYPVDITASGYTPQTTFNQQLSNYHSAKTAMYDAQANEMHMLFFGGMSQYYYYNGSLVQDDGVPFVKTISLLTRKNDGSLYEFALPIEMPSLNGSSAEFIPNENLSYSSNEVLLLNDVIADTFIVGYIIGGIHSNSLNPFNENNTDNTEAENTVYAVKLMKTDNPTGLINVVQSKSYDFRISPNPAGKNITIQFELDKPVSVDYFISDMQGKILESKELFVRKGINTIDIEVNKNWDTAYVMVNLSFADKYYVSKKALLK